MTLSSSFAVRVKVSIGRRFHQDSLIYGSNRIGISSQLHIAFYRCLSYRMTSTSDSCKMSPDRHMKSTNENGLTTSRCSTYTVKKTGQSIFIVRHGDRWDYSHPEFAKSEKNVRKGDTPLSDLGRIQARETGIFLQHLLQLSERSTDPLDVVVLCSPFLRCIETANEMLQQFTDRSGKTKRSFRTHTIRVEPSIWELDGIHNGLHHQHLRNVEEITKERSWYFPRVDTSHVPLFIPDLPESKEESLQRFRRVIDAIHNTYTYQPNQTIIIVTHAAACIGLVKAASQRQLNQITPAAPCCIYHLQRYSNKNKVWDMDCFTKRDGMNGHMHHISDAGQYTIPWNNYGPRCIHTNKSKYTGPPRSDMEPLFQYQPEYIL